jgi:methylase of polypeptide subunit release factors
LRRSSYTVDGIEELIGDTAVTGLARGRPQTVRTALVADTSPPATVVRLLLLGDDVPVDEAAAALPLDDAEPLLARDGQRVRAAYAVDPYSDGSHDWWVVSDRTDARGAPSRADHVLGVGHASTTLAGLTVRRPVARALDIGTGCGVQALHLSAHAQAVTATDVVDRALRLAATSFALSDVDVELVPGDLVEPVADREFDLVVCNPPFVVGPSPRFAYRDADWSRVATGEADALSRRALRAAAAVLADGGVAQLLVNWLHVRDEDWRERVGSWVADLGVDALLLERGAQGITDYVETWLADAGETGDDARAEQWRTWLASRGVEAVGFGWVTLRRGSAPHRVAVETVPQPVDQPLGDAVAGWLDRLDWLRTAGDEALLRARLRAADGVRLETSARPGDGGWRTAASRLVLGSGFRWSLECDEAVAAVVSGCDGSRPLADLLDVLVAATGVTRDDLAPAVCSSVRGLVDRGLLEPPS